MNYKRLFWILNITGWFSLFIVYLFTYYSRNLNNPKTIIGVFTIYLTGFFTSLILRKVYRRFYKKQRPIVQSSILLAVISLIATHVWYVFDVLSSCLIFLDWSFLNRNIVSAEADIMLRAPLLAAWSGFYYVFRLRNDLTAEKERAARSELLAHKAQLQMLRYQLNPHFLFNTLNTIRALVDEDRQKAKSIVTELSEFLRYSLLSKNNAVVAFSDELDAIKHYVEIQKIRYEEKLEVKMNIQDGIGKTPVLSFLIYPLIENAVKYGMKTSRMPLEVILNARTEGNYLSIEVINSGNWVDNSEGSYAIDKGTGQGIENVKLRLENAYGKNYEFNIKEDKGRVSVSLNIKMKENEKDF